MILSDLIPELKSKDGLQRIKPPLGYTEFFDDMLSFSIKNIFNHERILIYLVDYHGNRINANIKVSAKLIEIDFPIECSGRISVREF